MKVTKKQKERFKQYYRENKKELLKKGKVYYLENKDKISWKYYQNREENIVKSRKNYKKNKGKILKRLARWRDSNREKLRKYGKSYLKEYRKKYPERIKKYNRKNYLKYQKERIESARKYRKTLGIKERRIRARRYYYNNIEREHHYRKIKYARKKNAKGKYTLEEWEDLKKKFDYTCLMCSKKEPKIKLTADHKIPLSKKGTNYILNIQPLCRSCNSKKNNKLQYDF